jgi:1,2-diacylglycerol 3-alpha-glucosyltransferase
MDYRIGQFNDTFPPLMDGVSVVMWNYAYWLNKTFAKCYSIVPYFPDPEGNFKDGNDNPVLRYLSIPLPFRFPYRIGMPWFDAPFMAKLHKLDLDLVHSHNPFSAGLIARSYARKHHVPMVSTFHSSIHDFVDGLLHSRRITRMIVGKVVDYYESMDRVWVSSHFTRDVLKSYGYRGEPEIIPHGTDFTPPEDFAAARAAGNKFLGTDASANVLLYVGYISREKNLDFLIRALSHVKKRNIRFKMFFVGEGYARAELQREARNLCLNEDIRFAGVIRDRRLLRHWYARANLAVQPDLPISKLRLRLKACSLSKNSNLSSFPTFLPASSITSSFAPSSSYAVTDAAIAPQ